MTRDELSDIQDMLHVAESYLKVLISTAHKDGKEVEATFRRGAKVARRLQKVVAEELKTAQ